MDKKSKYLIFGLTLISVVSLYWNYRVFFVERDFLVDSTTTCDPAVEICFMWCEEGECEEEYYKKITKRAYNIPVCNAAQEECESLVCEMDEEDCTIVYCAVDTVQDQEVCTNPEDFKTVEPVAADTDIESAI